MLRKLWNDEAGFVISAELVLVLTIGVLSMVVGLNAVAKSVTMELNDVSNAIGAVDQSYSYTGLYNSHGNSAKNGSGFVDSQDECDCSVVYTPQPYPKTDASGRRRENR
ncbi:hypothetical protein MNBD_PLANCTO02-517 [hydrothermal vent metagenome]|uniref:Branched-chain amino acid aminotransferase n=1 Tax=hydrothermal vent metagenome TaxID=652676 RepID=A0A3B1DUS4_9ZZZZ